MGSFILQRPTPGSTHHLPDIPLAIGTESLPQTLSSYPASVPWIPLLSSLAPTDPTPRAAGAYYGLCGRAGPGECQGPGRPADRPRLEPLQQYPPGAWSRAEGRRVAGWQGRPTLCGLISPALSSPGRADPLRAGPPAPAGRHHGQPGAFHAPLQ